jgi:hypothetical protein
MITACGREQQGTSTPAAEYKIVDDGGAYVRDITKYESLGEKSLTRGQKYKIVSLAKEVPDAHFLVANITQFYGNKKGDVEDGKLLLVEDGSATYDCSKMIFDLKLADKDDDVPNVTCKFELVGTLPFASKATLRSTG